MSEGAFYPLSEIRIWAFGAIPLFRVFSVWAGLGKDDRRAFPVSTGSSRGSSRTVFCVVVACFFKCEGNKEKEVIRNTCPGRDLAKGRELRRLKKRKPNAGGKYETRRCIEKGV